MASMKTSFSMTKEVIPARGGGRNYSIDLLKIISMAMVLGLHTNRYGGFLDVTQPTWYEFVIKYYEHLCIVAVNVFVIISSWFLREKKQVSTKKVFDILLAILFWTAASLIVASLLGQQVGIKWLYRSIPFWGRAYDFLSGYLLLYMLSPVLNNMLNHSSKKQKAFLAFGSILVFSLMVPITTSHYLQIGNGYSFAWFICLYFIIAFLKDNDIHINKWLALFLYLLLALVGTVSEIFQLPFLRDLSYNNFIVLASSLAIFLFFKSIRINSVVLMKIIDFLAPMTLGVFLIHDHNLMEQFYETLGMYKWLNGIEYSYVFLFPLFLSLIYLLCSLLELSRKILFSLFRIPDVVAQLSSSFDKKMDKIISH